MIFDGHANLSHKYGNMQFWLESHYVFTIGLYDATIRKYIRDQESANIAMNRRSAKEYEDPN